MRTLGARVKRWAANADVQTAFLLVVIASPVTLKALSGFFTFDDLMNLSYYNSRPWWSLGSNLIVFTSLRRPLGAVPNLALYHTVGLDPFFYYLTGIAIFSLNLVLVYALFRRLTGSRATSTLAAALAAYHPQVHNVLYNFGAVYELLMLTFVITALWLYARAADTGWPPRTHIASWLCYLAALNAKETAVVLPALLVVYELVYRVLWSPHPATLRGIMKRTALFWAVAAPYTLVKFLGEEAYWRDNELYVYHLDKTIVDNLARYFSVIAYRELEFNSEKAVALVILICIVAIYVRNRHVLFGAAWGLLFLAPVLPLPRVWGLFLYAALPGFALMVSAGLWQAATWLWRTFRERLPQRPLPAPVRLALTALLLAGLLAAAAPAIDDARKIHYDDLTGRWRSFSSQLESQHPNLPGGAVLGFEGLTFEQPHLRWVPYFLVHLRYRRGVRFFLLPEQEEAFRQAVKRAPESHRFKWQDGRLIERPLSTD